MFLVGNRSVNMILINECVNGCSLFEDNSHRLLDVSTMTHRAHTKMWAWSLHGVGLQADMPTGSTKEHALSSQKGHTAVQSHTQGMCTKSAGIMQDTWDAGCQRMSEDTHKYTFTTHTIYTQCTHNTWAIHTSPTTTHNVQRAPISPTQYTYRIYHAHRIQHHHPHDTHTMHTKHPYMQHTLST